MSSNRTPGTTFRVFRALATVVSVVGTLFFGTILATVLLNPLWVEQKAREAIRVEVESRVKEKLTTSGNEHIERLAGKAAERLGAERLQALQQIRDGLPQRVARVVADMANADCECRRRIEAATVESFKRAVVNIASRESALTNLIRAKYQDTVEKLLREIAILSGANALVFALLGLAVVLRPGANIHLVPTAFVLVLSAGVVGYLYLFQQDWLNTILFANYVGLAYFAYLGVAFALLCDVFFNRARFIVGVLNSLGSITLSPC